MPWTSTKVLLFHVAVLKEHRFKTKSLGAVLKRLNIQEDEAYERQLLFVSSPEIKQ